MVLIYWTIRREIERRRNSKAAMREMRRYGYKAEWACNARKCNRWLAFSEGGPVGPGIDLAVKRHDWRRYAA